MGIALVKVLEDELTQKYFMSVWTPIAESVCMGGPAHKKSFEELARSVQSNGLMVPSQVETLIKRFSSRTPYLWCRQHDLRTGSSLSEMVIDHLTDIKKWLEAQPRIAEMEEFQRYNLIVLLQSKALSHISNLANF